MHSYLIVHFFQGALQGWPIKLLTQLDYVNQQLVLFEVNRPVTRNNKKLAATSESKFFYLIIATKQHLFFFSKKKWDFI